MKEKIRKKGFKRRAWAMLIALTLVLSSFPCSSTLAAGERDSWTYGNVLITSNLPGRDYLISGGIYSFWWNTGRLVINNIENYIRVILKEGWLGESEVGELDEVLLYDGDEKGLLFRDGDKYIAICVTGSEKEMDHADGLDGGICHYCGFGEHIHTWSYSADGATLTATSTCHDNSSCEYNASGEKTATLTISATPQNYSGSPVTKADIFGGMDFTTFNDATKLNLSAADIKIYAATDTSKATALDTINAAGSYVADLTVGTQTATLDFKVAKMIEFKDLQIGTVVEVGDILSRGELGYGYLNFGNEFFGLNDEEDEEYSYNNILTWMIGSEVPTYNCKDSELPAWYASTKIFVVTKIDTDPDGPWTCYDIYFEPYHTYSYSVNDAKLTATCDKECDAATAHTATLTLSASNADYSGSVVTANYGSGEAEAWKSAVGSDAPTITYEKKGEGSAWTALTSAPSEVGEYRAVAKVINDGTDYIAYKEFTISKADISSVTFTEPTAPAYGGTPASSVAGTGANYSGAISWSPAATTFGYSTAYTATIKLTASDNYKFKSDVTIPTNWTKSASSTDTSLVLTRTYTATEAAPHTCGSGVKQDGQAATCTADGFKDYYKCGSCDKLYNEVACTNEITDLATWKTTDGQGKIAKLGHSWGYNASGATLTATCSRDSSHTATLTLSASDANYSGSGVEPTITYGTTDEQAAWTNAGVKLPKSEDPGAPTVTKTYYNANSSGQKVGDALDSTPVNAGNYVVEVTITYGTGVEAGQKASVALSYEIKKAAAPAAPSGLTATAPQYIGGNDGKITGVDTTMEYSTDGTLWRSVTGTEITGLSTGTVYVRKAETANVLAGTPTTVTVADGTNKNPAPAAPTGLTVVPASALGASDGKITGIDPSTMEYSLDNGATWINVPGTEITELEAGKNVQVRLKETDTHLASLPNTLMINYHTHSWSWKFDKTSHWQECECGAKQNEADHSYVNGKCICGSKKAKPVAVYSDVKEEHSAPEAVRAAEEMFLPLNVVEQDKTGVNRDHFGIVPDKAYNLTAYVTIQGFVSAINKIEKANPKANTVSIYTGKPFTFNKRIVETIQKGGKTIIYYFYHKGHLYSVTVPATVDASKVLEKAGFAGPLYVGKQLGTTKLVK